MLLDLLSTDMSVSYNVKLAHRIGLHTSIYVAELINIYRKATQKGKIVDGKYFRVDRDYIELRTTLTKEEQRELDQALKNISVVKISSNSRDTIGIDIEELSKLVLDDDANKIEGSVKTQLKKKAPTKKDAIIAQLKSYVSASNDELRDAYYEWIEEAYARNGWMSAASIREAQRAIDNYSGKDLDIALDILHIASTNGYKDIMWAIDRYEKNGMYKKITAQVNSTTEAKTPKATLTFTDEVY